MATFGGLPACLSVALCLVDMASAFLQMVVMLWGESQRDIEMVTQILEQVFVCCQTVLAWPPAPVHCMCAVTGLPLRAMSNLCAVSGLPC